MPHRQEPKPANATDAVQAVIARAAELVDYIRKREHKHITEADAYSTNRMAPMSITERAIAELDALRADLGKMADDAEHLVNILEGKALQEWNYDYQREAIKRARHRAGGAALNAEIDRLRATEARLRAALTNAVPHLPHGGPAWLDAKAALAG